MSCDLLALCDQMACMKQDLDILWNDRYGPPDRKFIFTGGIGIPDNNSFTPTPSYDIREYTFGSSLINLRKPDGVFIVGDANFDLIPVQPGYYDLFNQEKKVVTGFSELLLEKKLYPVMGDTDWWIAQDLSHVDRIYTRLFDYLPDAQRYYSVYDDESQTEFFILSSGRYKDYYAAAGSHEGFVYPNDATIGSDQHIWFTQKAASSPAKNKVVIFHEPFTSISNTFAGVRNKGPVNVFSSFSDWDFEGAGVKLIINGHSGNSYHLKKGAVNIINCSAFCGSRFGITEVSSNVEPPYISTLYGVQGYALMYFSHRKMTDPTPTNVNKPGAGYYVIPYNTFVEITADKSGLKVDFVAYDPQSGEMQDVVNSASVEYTFEIPANT